MDPFTQSLRAQVEKALGQTSPWGDVNPLVVIGLTEAILDLGLSEDQLYATIRSYGRQLAAQVHPDRKPENVSPERQRQILGAFEILDDRENFTRALSQFKTIRAEDRRESRILFQTITNLKSKLSGFENQYQQLEESRKRLEEERQEFQKLQADEPLLLPSVKEERDYFLKRTEELQHAVTTSKATIASWRTRSESLAHYIAYLGKGKLQTSGILSFEARWIAVVSLTWNADQPEISPLNSANKPTARFLEVAQSLAISKTEIKSMLIKWREAQKKYGTPEVTERKLMPLGFSLISLRCGVQKLAYGVNSGVNDGRIIGSIPTSEHLVPTRDHLRRQMLQEEIYQKFFPYIFPDSVLISITTERRRRIPWSITCPAFKLFTKRIVLALG